MNMLGYSLDNLSLMALTLAIGFLVDDAIVFLENTVRLMEAGQERRSKPRWNSRARNQLHDSGHDDFACRGIYSAGVHDRPGGPHLPRIFDHHHRVHLRQRHRFADAHAADVLQAAGPARAKAPKKTWMERVIGGVENAAFWMVYGRLALVFPAASLDLGADLGDLPGRDRLPVLRRA